MPRRFSSISCAFHFALALLATTQWARSQEVFHGADSLFVAPTVKIAWAVRRGATEEDTIVVLRIVNSAGSYRQVSIDGVDPFSKSRKVLAAAQPLTKSIELTLPRSGFAEYPSCEIHLYAKDIAAEKPSLTVYYLGVPDTTPEFRTAQDAGAYLTKALGQ
jgi:hypothetical protein